jgi:hypothetical protein
MFESAGAQETDEAISKMQKSQSPFDIQKDIIYLTEIIEYLAQYLSKEFIPKFKAEKARQYKLIISEYTRVDTANTKSVR